MSQDLGTTSIVAGSNPFTMKALAAAVGRRWRSAIFIGLLVGVAAGVWSWVYFPPLYISTAIVLAALPDPTPLETNRMTNRDDADNFQRTQMALVRSKQVIKTTLKRPEIRDSQVIRAAANPVSMLEKRLQVSYQDGTDLMKISMTDVRPDDLAPLLNAIKESYLQEARDIRKKMLDARSNEIAELVAKSEERLQRLRVELRNLSGGPDLPVAEVTGFDALVREHSKVQSELRKAEGLVTLCKERVASAESYKPSASEIDEVVALDSMVIGCEKELAELDTAIKAHTAKALPRADDNILNGLNNRVTEVRANREKAAKEIGSRATATLIRKVKETAAKNLAAAEDIVTIHKRNERDLQKDVDAKTPLPFRGHDAVAQKKLEVSQAEVALRQLRDVQEKLLIENLTVPKNLATFPGGDAETPAEPDRTVHIRRVALTGIAGLLFGIALVGIWELLTQRLSTREEVTKALGLRVIGDLPLLMNKGWFGPSTASSAASFATALNTLRAVLLLGNEKQTARVILITSAVPGEGKTTLAYNLAFSLSRANLRTLLVDGDLLRPRLHERFDVPVGPGLGNVINEDITLASAARLTPYPDLYFLAAGNCSPTVSDTLHGPRAEALFQELRSGWDVIIIDGPPVLAAAEPLLIGRHVDAALVAVRSGVSVAPHVRSACQQLADAQVPVLGVVLNGAPSRTNAYYGYHPPVPIPPRPLIVAADEVQP